ncbi:MAG: preprotein translocase subunit SecG [Deltaproteobacteria bacterium]|nr:preprotein translocase subunit SecG [Deltaproteobacteria bacterium]
MFQLVLTFHLALCVAMIFLVLLQQGKGADAGATFGGSSSTTVFGASGASTLLTKATTLGAILFMVSSIVLVKMYPAGVVQSQSSQDILSDSVLNTEAASETVDSSASEVPVANDAVEETSKQ